MKKLIITTLICLNFSFIISQNNNYKITNSNINNAQLNFGSTYFNTDFLIYASPTKLKTIKKKGKKKKSKQIISLDFYFGFVDQYGSINNEEKLNKDINSEFDEIDLTFSNDYKTVYFTRNIKSNNKNHLELFKGDVVTPGYWINITKLPFCSENYSVGHPSLSEDNKTLYFASDMSGTLGSLDIFKVAILSNNTYGKPKNLGSNINTSAKETTPFISGNTLYFSSNGKKGFGGQDIYHIALKNNAIAVNLGAIINSEKDDVAFTKKNNNNKGYFSSNRFGGKGNYDIYYFENEDDSDGIVTENISVKQTKKKIVTSVFNNDTKSVNSKSIEQRKIDLEITPVTNPVKSIVKKIIQTKNKVVKNKNISENNTKLQVKFQYVDELKNKYANANEFDKCQYMFDNLNNIYFDYNKAYIRTDAADELDKVIKIMRECPNINVIASSYTDSRATYDYNMVLSQERAEKMAVYILRNGGFSSNRIKGIGYGEARLRNRCADGIICVEEEHQINRRTEFEISNY